MSLSIMQSKEQSQNEKHRKRIPSQREDRNRNVSTVDKAMNLENRNVLLLGKKYSKCAKRNHFAAVCKQSQKKVHMVHDVSSSDESIMHIDHYVG